MTDHTTPGPVGVVGDLLDAAHDAQEPRELTRLWRRRGDADHGGLFAHAVSSHAGALAVIEDDLGLHWFREAEA